MIQCGHASRQIPATSERLMICDVSFMKVVSSLLQSPKGGYLLFHHAFIGSLNYEFIKLHENEITKTYHVCI
jgi:hypothetical protein